MMKTWLKKGPGLYVNNMVLFSKSLFVLPVGYLESPAEDESKQNEYDNNGKKFGAK
jgi:hypothetical protein